MTSAGPAFVPSIDLMDETIREGVERCPIVPDPGELAELAERIAALGLRTIVVGFLPRHQALLGELLARQAQGRIPAAARFMVISHLGEPMERTAASLAALGPATERVEVITIFPASDDQLEYLLPAVNAAGAAPPPDPAASPEERRAQRRRASLDTLARALGRAAELRPVERLMFSVLDAYRSQPDHVGLMVGAATALGIRQIRIVDTSGVATPERVRALTAALLTRDPALRLYGHFHNDYELATANALSALAAGFMGVDVSVGGFANRAGHPSLAGLTMALRDLHGVTLAGFDYAGLSALSRASEHCLGLMESPTQAVTGVITHTSLNGHRSDLLELAPRLFSHLVPADAGAEADVRYGGSDGLRNFLTQHAAALAAVDEARVRQAWERRNGAVTAGIRAAIDAYHQALLEAAPSEADMLAFITQANTIEEDAVCT